MKKILNFGLFFGLLTVFIGATDSLAATTTKTKKQSALQAGTKVRAKVEANGIYDQECFDKYFGCSNSHAYGLLCFPLCFIFQLVV